MAIISYDTGTNLGKMANNVGNVLAICGVNTDNNDMTFNGATAAARVSDEVFDNTFDTFLDITFTELDDN